MELERFFDDDLAQCSYAIACPATGEVAIIDPMRDIDGYIDWAETRGWTITHAVETHIHADFVCGARELAAATGARLIVSGEAPDEWKYRNLDRFDARRLRDREEFSVGNVTLRALHTPGHTPEHMSYAIVDDDGSERFLLTGDFLFVDDLGRPDLLEKAARQEDTAIESARQMYDSIRTIVDAVPAGTVYWPGHGAGSACGKSQSSVPVSSVGREARMTWWGSHIRSGDRDGFVEHLLADQPEVPPYFARMKTVNRDGAEILGGLGVPRRLHPEHFRRTLDEQRAVVIDVSDASAFASSHAAGSLSMPLQSLSTYAGWLLSADDDVVLVCEQEQVELAVRKLKRVGFDRIDGWVPTADYAPRSTFEQVDADELFHLWRDNQVEVLDVRSASEFESGHIPQAKNIHYGQLQDALDDLDPEASYVVHCASGVRSTIAASLLERSGFDDVRVYEAGPDEWQSAGYPTDG